MKNKCLSIVASFVFATQVATALLPSYSHIYYFGDSFTDMGNYVEANPTPCVNVSAPVTNTLSGSNAGSTWANNNSAGFSASASKLGGNDWAVAGA
jgi:phospholipase/lecithinase/hemolysin